MYDTYLNDKQMWEYNKWLQENKRGLDEKYYDLRGIFRDGAKLTENGHGSDYYKKPNHPTFSEESKYNNTPSNSMYGKIIREMYPSELNFFQRRPDIGGYAAEDGKIALNPFSSLPDEQMDTIARNEAIRLWLRDMPNPPSINMTTSQTNAFASYSPNERDRQDTLLARILTGDPSALDVTPEQRGAANSVMDYIQQYSTPPTNQGGRWNEDGSFTPGPTNYEYYSPEEMLEYFQRFEPGVVVNFPAGIIQQLLGMK